MSNVAESLKRDKERYREYKRSDDEAWGEDVVPRADYDTDPRDLSDDQLKQQFADLTDLQKKEMDNDDPQGLAEPIAKRRNDLWKDAKRRGVESKLL